MKQKGRNRLREKLKKRRLQLDLTQEAVATNANISRAFYTEIETGRKNCSMQVWLKIGAALNIPEEELINYIKEGMKKGA